MDHKNGNGLDCRRSNMRIATRTQNQYNKRPNRTSRTGLKGIERCRPSGRYAPRITINGKRASGFGSYSTAEEAARAYDELAKVYYGEFAWLNFPSEDRSCR